MKLLILAIFFISVNVKAGAYVCGEQIGNPPESDKCMIKVYIPGLFKGNPDPFAFIKFAQLCQTLSFDSTRPLSKRGFYPIYTGEDKNYIYELKHKYFCENIYKKDWLGRRQLVGKKCEVAFQVLNRGEVIHEGHESEFCKKGDNSCFGLYGLMENAIDGPFNCE